MRTKATLGDAKLIDHHCDIGDMGGNSCAANYMEMYPFIDTLWYGEGEDVLIPAFWEHLTLRFRPG